MRRAAAGLIPCTGLDSAGGRTTRTGAVSVGPVVALALLRRRLHSTASAKATAAAAAIPPRAPPMTGAVPAAVTDDPDAALDSVGDAE